VRRSVRAPGAASVIPAGSAVAATDGAWVGSAKVG
jgi:hypothetical protein